LAGFLTRAGFDDQEIRHANPDRFERFAVDPKRKEPPFLPSPRRQIEPPLGAASR